MARPSKITLAQPVIEKYFTDSGKLVYSKTEFENLLSEKQQVWDLPYTMSPERIIKKLLNNNFIKEISLKFSDDSTHTVYAFGNPSIFEIAGATRSKSYISHYPAVYLHDLTAQVPKTIYTTRELTAKGSEAELKQAGIDRAFSKPQRRSQVSAAHEDYTIVLLNGKFSGRTGVFSSARYRNAFSYTNLERTLIDIAVRPNYSGGSFAVLEAYRAAVQTQNISGQKLLNYYKTLDFIYPYHQAIGFYLERAGAQINLVEELRMLPKKFKFYIDYDMQEKEFDKTWRIWHPKGM